MQHDGQLHRLAGEVGAQQVGPPTRRVSGGEGQIDRAAHLVEPVSKLVVDGRRQGNAGRDDLLLGPCESGRHGRCGHQEQPGDLLGGGADHQPQGQRRARFGAQRRMATQQDDVETLVAKRLDVTVRRGSPARPNRQHRRQSAPDGLGTKPADEQPVRGGVEPTPGVVRHAVGRPSLGGPGERLGKCVLGQVEPSGAGHQQRQQPAPIGPVGGRNRPLSPRRGPV